MSTGLRKLTEIYHRFFSTDSKKCAICKRRMRKIENEKGHVLLRIEEKIIGVGTAEKCWECGRVYCDECYPARPRNTCICGKGRDKIRHIAGVTYQGSLRLIKVRYLP